MTEWHDYRRPSFARLKQTMRTPVVFDGRNAWMAGPDTPATNPSRSRKKKEKEGA